MTTPNPPPNNVTCRRLFVGFGLIGLCGFGGVLPWARRFLVERYGWVAVSEFNELVGLCQILPGPNVINLAVLLGTRYRGWRGALAAQLGILLPPMLIVLALGLVWQRWHELPMVAGLLRGIGAVGAGLILATALKMIAAYRGKPFALFWAALVFVAIGVVRLPLAPVMLVLTPLVILVAIKKGKY